MAAARFLRSAFAAALLGLLLAPVPAPAASRVSVRVEFYYGAAAAGGVGFFLWISGGWQAYLAGNEPAGALLEISQGAGRFGLPLPQPWEDPDQGPGAAPRGIRADLLTVRF